LDFQHCAEEEHGYSDYIGDYVKNEILALSVMDYCSGPMKDPEMGGDVWVFGRNIEGKEIYIKLKLIGDHRDQGVAVLSFHPAERTLAYYFKHK